MSSLFQRFDRQKEEDAKITYLPDRTEEDAEDPDTSTNAPEEEQVLTLPSSKASPSNPIRDWSDDDDADVDDDCYVVEVRDAIPAIPISYSLPEPSSADSAAQMIERAPPLAAEPGPPPAPKAKTAKKAAKKPVRKNKGPRKVPTGPLSGARALVAESG